MAKDQGTVGADKDDIVSAMPLACGDERAAVELMELLRWGGCVVCPHCKAEGAYQMKDRKTGSRSARFLWRCLDCGKQFTVKVGTVMEDSRIAYRHWCYAWWAACSSKKGVSALQIKRQTGLSYRSALFLMHRVRWAMAGDEGGEPLGGEGKTVEADETWVGGKPRRKGYRHGKPVRAAWTTKKPVIAMIERDGKARLRVMERVTAKTLGAQLKRHVDTASILATDEHRGYKIPGKTFAKHLSVTHSKGVYALLNGAHCNTAESLFAIVKRGLYGTFHSVSKHHLHRYMSEFEFRWNQREATDGARTMAAVQQGVGKRLTYKQPVGE